MTEQYEAGPELDRLIAEKVMGWKIIDYESNGEFTGNAMPHEDGYCLKDKDGNERQHGEEAHQWHPSTKISNAWEVVEAITKQEPRKIVRVHHNSDMSICRIIDFHSCDTIGEGGALTAPLAICRAALSAALTEEAS